MSADPILPRIQQAVVPFDVYVRDVHAHVADEFDPKRRMPSELGFQIRHEVGRDGTLIELESDEGSAKMEALRYIVETGVRFLEEGPASEDTDTPVSVRAEIIATWVVEYQVVRREDVDESGIAAFAENNVMYHVWPYWREFIHATCARLRLPQVVLPMFKIRHRASKKEESSPSPRALEHKQ
jgi:hypothetical protein